MRRLSEAKSSCSSGLLVQLNVEELENASTQEIVDAINCALLEPMEEYRLPSAIEKLTLEEDHAPEFLLVSEHDVYKKLSHLNPVKASGPDGIPNWLLKEHSEFLANPITTMLNASFKEQRLSIMWKLADVSPLPKTKPVKDLRPISLTPCISKVAEDFVVTQYVKPAVLSALDSSQYGAIPKSSTTLALLEMLHVWSQGTDGSFWKAAFRNGVKSLQVSRKGPN